MPSVTIYTLVEMDNLQKQEEVGVEINTLHYGTSLTIKQSTVDALVYRDSFTGLSKRWVH